MDPFTLALIAAGPTILSQFDRPSAPSFQQIALPDREKWANELLNNAYRTDTSMVDASRARLMEDINAQLAARGMGNSSQGFSMQSGAMAELMNRWMENQVARQAQAYGAVKQGDMGALHAQQAQNQNLMDQYEISLAAHKGKWGGVQNLVDLGLGAYGKYQANLAAEEAKKQAERNWMAIRGPTLAASGGYTVAPPTSHGLGGNYTFNNPFK